MEERGPDSRNSPLHPRRRPELRFAFYGQLWNGVPNGFGELQCGDLMAYTLWKNGVLHRRATPSEAAPALRQRSTTKVAPFCVSQSQKHDKGAPDEAAVPSTHTVQVKMMADGTVLVCPASSSRAPSWTK
eukprot:scaffold4250_cov247-Pinguiococcus_pyrenoidosus.AAC.1